MALLTKSALDAAYKPSLIYGASGITSLATGWIWGALNSANPQPGVGGPATPAAIGSGGSALANLGTGLDGFLSKPNGDGVIYGVESLNAFVGTLTAGGMLSIFDLVWAASGVVGNIATAQNVTGFPTLPRYPTGEGLELMLAVQTSAGTTSTGYTVSYTNQAGVAGRTGNSMLAAITNLSTAGIAHPMSLQAGDTGIQSVQSVTLGVAQAAAGGLWLLLGRRLATFNTASTELAGDRILDAMALGLQPFFAGACLAMIGGGCSSNTTSANRTTFAMG